MHDAIGLNPSPFPSAKVVVAERPNIFDFSYYVQQTTMSQLFVKKLRENAVIPSRQTSGSVGFDLTTTMDIIIMPHKTELIQTGIAICIPVGHYGHIMPRSGWAVKGLAVNAGVIDQDYRGEIKVVCFNTTPSPIEISKGNRVAQLIIEKISVPEVVVVEEFEQTTRNTNGFGSSGN